MCRSYYATAIFNNVRIWTTIREISIVTSNRKTSLPYYSQSPTLLVYFISPVSQPNSLAYIFTNFLTVFTLLAVISIK